MSDCSCEERRKKRAEIDAELARAYEELRVVRQELVELRTNRKQEDNEDV